MSTFKIDEILKKFALVTSYIGKHGSITYGENNEKFGKRDLKLIEKTIVGLSKPTKKGKRSNTREKKILPILMSDQWTDFLASSNFGIGISDFLKLHNYSEDLNEDGTDKKVQNKVRTFLKSHKLYPEAKEFYKNIFEKEFTSDSEIDQLIDFRNQMKIIITEKISSITLNLSIFSFIDKIRGEYNAVNSHRRIISDLMKEYFDDKSKVGFYFNGSKLDFEKSPTITGLENLNNNLKKNSDTKKIIYIPESENIDGEFGYLHTALMSIYSIYVIPKECYTKEQEDLLKSEHVNTELKILQKRIKDLKG